MPKDSNLDDNDIVWVPDREMSVRDWFAAHALSGMASISLEDGDMIMGWADMAKAAYKAADSMLAERSKP